MPSIRLLNQTARLGPVPQNYHSRAEIASNLKFTAFSFCTTHIKPIKEARAYATVRDGPISNPTMNKATSYHGTSHLNPNPGSSYNDPSTLQGIHCSIMHNFLSDIAKTTATDSMRLQYLSFHLDLCEKMLQDIPNADPPVSISDIRQALYSLLATYDSVLRFEAGIPVFLPNEFFQSVFESQQQCKYCQCSLSKKRDELLGDHRTGINTAGELRSAFIEQQLQYHRALQGVSSPTPKGYDTAEGFANWLVTVFDEGVAALDHYIIQNQLPSARIRLVHGL